MTHSRQNRPVKAPGGISGPALAVALAWFACAGTANAQPGAVRVTEPIVVVVAQKEPADMQRLPLSVTAVPETVLRAERISTLGEASLYAPNTFFSEFQPRKLSFPRFRGISSGPGNPAITTYVDGVPMIHTNASNVELLDVEQVEFVRGGQSALFGRNALGGIMNVTSARPSLSRWTGRLSVPFGNFGAVDARGTVSGPLGGKAAVSVSAGRSVRDGFTINDVTGHDLDPRRTTFAKAQLLFVPASRWETRFIVGGERSRDGDYALMDLGSLRRDPFHARRDFEGRTDRDLRSGTFLVRREGARLTFSATTGVVDWSATDVTDLDYSPFPAATRTNDEEATQVTQEIRLASSVSAPLRLSGSASLRWQAGMFLFSQGYEQNAVNTYSPFVVSQLIPSPVVHTSPAATLDDRGVGIFGQATLTLRERFDVALGARLDRERKEAELDSFYVPAIAPPGTVVADRSFSNVAPQISAAWRLTPARMLYASAGTGYKSGGFNPASPAGAESFGEEQTWQIESGIKTTWVGGRVRANAAFFYIDWDDLQLNLPNPLVPAQFYVANVGGARSTGVELEASARASSSVELFGALGYTSGRFADGSISSGVDVSDNRLPSTPDVTATLGARVQRAIARYTVFGSGDVQVVGTYQYDDLNTASQEAYALTNLRAGVQRGPLSVEGWIRNAFDTRYIPVVFPFGQGAPSGFVGEMGRPRTFGVSLGLGF
jgi:iron complex outermembrane recepter protein